MKLFKKPGVKKMSNKLNDKGNPTGMTVIARILSITKAAKNRIRENQGMAVHEPDEHGTHLGVGAAHSGYPEKKTHHA
jgi:Tfp pilus assembly pilus retraction ATPase PilT